ncbi:hypothetical protein L3X38_035190 [Prunus dulcis]|uniref:Uncharacterized protein n=1 Tax=Prunus dulcis TaxID=3755 RepID=A0AAD4VLI3_PRUDU|nr:hypothetical protein L3X38_035190 [Prunus dulcis]
MHVAVKDADVVLLLGHLLNAKQRLDKALAEVKNELDSVMAKAEKIEGLQMQQRREEREHLRQMLQLVAKAYPISSLSLCLTHSHRMSSSMVSIFHPKHRSRSISASSLLVLSDMRLVIGV